jgi:phage-related protein
MSSEKIPLLFYRTLTGNEPVREWLRGLAEDDRKVIGRDLQRVQFRWPVGMPLARPLMKGLSEVRTDLPSNRIARVLFFVERGRIGVVHGFIKKTQKTPKADLDLALARMKEMLE